MLIALSSLLAAAGLNVVAAAPAAAIPGLVNASVTTASNTIASKSAIAMCPAPLRVVGGGARLSVLSGEVSITAMSPTVGADGYQARAYEDLDKTALNWSLTVTAICAPTPRGYTIVTATGPSGSPTAASMTATCPAGLQVLGTGGAVFPGAGVLLTGAIPSPATSPTSVTVIGAEIAGGYPGNWNVQAWAICTAPVTGHAVVTTASAIDSSPWKNQTSTCPAGSLVHGLGFQFGGGTGELFLNSAYPSPATPVGTSVPVVASEDQSGLPTNWVINAHAICAP